MRYGLLLCALALGLAGCVEDDLSLTIVRFSGITEANMCVPTVTSTVFQSGGELDVGIVQAGAANGYHGYILAPIVQNNLVDRTMGNTTAIQTDAIDLTGFDIELVADSADPEVSQAIASLPAANRKFRLPVAGGRINPGGATGMMSQVAVEVEAINSDVSRVLANAIQMTGARSGPPLIVHMRPVGNRAGLEIVGGYSDFPVNICKFCLTPPPQACPTTGFKAADVQVGGCFPEQDEPVTCCTDTSGNLLCGGHVPMATAM